jgi:DNA-binding CsgD family transcriptional regulator
VTGLLTPKEGEVLRLVARNLSNKQIARALGVGDETVKRRVKNLFRKLNAARREHLVVSGADAGPSRTELIRRQTIPATGPLCPRGGTTRRRTATTVDAVGSDAPHAYVLSDSDRTAISA